MNFKDSERPWLLSGVLGAILLTAGAWFTVIGPEFANAASVQSQTADAATQNTLLQAKTSKLKQQSTQLPALQKQLVGKLAQLPTDAQYSQLTAQVNQQAAKAGVELTSVAFTLPAVVGNTGSDTAAGQTYSIGLTIAANGPFDSVQRFLRLLQQVGPRAALVGTVSISSSAKNYSLSATLTAYTTPLTQVQSDKLQSELTAVAPSN